MKRELNHNKTNERKLIRSFVETKNLTALCRQLRKWGIVRQMDIYHLFKRTFSDRFFRKNGIDTWSLCFDVLKRDLDKKEVTEYMEVYDNFTKQMQRNKAAGAYMKVLFEGHNNIYWCSPIYGHADYNKHVWAENTPENRRKMEIINNFLKK